MHKLGYKDHFMCTKEQMINSSYPFAVCIELKELSVIESATQCYLNDKAGRMKTIKELKQILKKIWYSYFRRCKVNNIEKFRQLFIEFEKETKKKVNKEYLTLSECIKR